MSCLLFALCHLSSTLAAPMDLEGSLSRRQALLAAKIAKKVLTSPLGKKAAKKGFRQVKKVAHNKQVKQTAQDAALSSLTQAMTPSTPAPNQAGEVAAPSASISARGFNTQGTIEELD
ncbi:hypothetical protein C8J56DRAFT_1048633 [Mycena floridula]|nr:hypothetical protein C8J56DRAFT_1048633 [Mycena floridula]